MTEAAQDFFKALEIATAKSEERDPSVLPGQLPLFGQPAIQNPQINEEMDSILSKGESDA
jgi:hypothetical protein